MILDSRTEFKLSKVCPDVAIRWKEAAKYLLEHFGRQMGVTDGYRSYSEQWSVYSKGRLKDKNGHWIVCDSKLVVTHAMPGQSLHNFGLAIDSCFLGDDPFLDKLPRAEANALWDVYGKAVKAQGLEWGGDWQGAKNDRPHCQMSYGLSIHTLQMVYEDKGIPGVWEKCKNTLLCGGRMV